jgi:hypothetical protein
VSRKKLIDLEHPFFAPLWVRIAVVVVCVAWGSFEFARGAALWGTLFLGVAAVCAWRFATIDYTAGRDE